MKFTGQLPELDELCRIAGAVPDFPATTEEITETATLEGYGKNVIDFINLFPHRGQEEFLSRSDFYTRAAELAMLICEERQQPPEKLKSPEL